MAARSVVEEHEFSLVKSPARKGRALYRTYNRHLFSVYKGNRHSQVAPLFIHELEKMMSRSRAVSDSIHPPESHSIHVRVIRERVSR